MRLTISGIHMDTGPALQAHAEERLQGIKTYFDQIIDVHVSFVQEPHHHHLHGAELTVHANGITLRAEGAGIDWHAALDDAAAKLERQLDRYKGRLLKHRERRKKYAAKLKDMAGVAMSVEHSTVDEGALDGVPEDMFAEFAPSVVKKDVSALNPMTVDEAIMQMDLMHRPAYLFLNAQSGKLNMVYREGDGTNTVRWVAPK